MVNEYDWFYRTTDYYSDYTVVLDDIDLFQYPTAFAARLQLSSVSPQRQYDYENEA